MTSVLNMYVKEMHHVILSKDEELQLATRYRAGDQKAGNALVVANLRFALKMAHKYVRYNFPIEDLVQEANLGLLNALHKFDPAQGFRFVTYAVWWIDAKLRMYVMKNFSLVKFGTTALERRSFGRASAIHDRLEATHPTAVDTEIFEMLAVELRTNIEKARELYYRTSKSDVSLNMVASNIGRALEHQDLLPGRNVRVDDQLIAAEAVFNIQTLVLRCAKNPKEQLIIEKRLLADEPWTLSQLGTHLKLSRERVRHIETNLKRRLRDLV
jgi:RNA polymerase sigma-32 factor